MQYSEAYLQLSETSKIRLFVKLLYLGESPIVEAQLGSKYTSDTVY